MDIYIGFDSAWVDNPRAPGAICAVGMESGVPTVFHRPRLVWFSQALAFIKEVRTPSGVSLAALDQPTLAPNAASMRRLTPLDRSLSLIDLNSPSSPARSAANSSSRTLTTNRRQLQRRGKRRNQPRTNRHAVGQRSKPQSNCSRIATTMVSTQGAGVKV